VAPDRLDVEPDLRPPLDAADLTLGNLREQPHAAQIADGEENRRVHRGGDCLADLHVPSNHHAVNRGSNHGAIEVHARLRDDRPRCRDVRVGGPDVGRRLQHCGLCEIEFGARELLIAGKRLRRLELRTGIVEYRLTTSALGFCLGKSRFGFDEPRLKRRRIEPGQHLTALDPRVEIGRQRGNGARDLRSDVHHPRGLERTADQDLARDGTTRDCGGLDLDPVTVPSGPHDRHDCRDRHGCNDDHHSPAI
jgi:hypothetical protein